MPAGETSWREESFTPASASTRANERREARYRLRALLREVTGLKRCAGCGMPLGASSVAVKVSADGVAHFSGLVTCGSVWVCPVCAAKIRAFRASEIARGLAGLIERGGGALFVTLTLPHEAGDALTRTMDLVSDGFAAVASGRPYRRERDEHGILGHIRAFEVTHGKHGWHPHLHIALALNRPAPPRVAALLTASWQDRWDRWLIGSGWSASVSGVGVRIDVVRRAEDLADYLAKVQDGADLTGYQPETRVGVEMARADLKVARKSSRTPFEILADFGTDGNVTDLDLWHEFERATKGKSAIRWSKGLRALLLTEDELTDEEVAAADVDGDVVALLDPSLWRRLAQIPGADATLLLAVERGGYRELLVTLVGLHLGVDGVRRPEQVPA